MQGEPSRRLPRTAGDGVARASDTRASKLARSRRPKAGLGSQQAGFRVLPQRRRVPRPKGYETLIRRFDTPPRGPPLSNKSSAASFGASSTSASRRRTLVRMASPLPDQELLPASWRPHPVIEMSFPIAGEPESESLSRLHRDLHSGDRSISSRDSNPWQLAPCSPASRAAQDLPRWLLLRQAGKVFHLRERSCGAFLNRVHWQASFYKTSAKSEATCQKTDEQHLAPTAPRLSPRCWGVLSLKYERATASRASLGPHGRA